MAPGRCKTPGRRGGCRCAARGGDGPVSVAGAGDSRGCTPGTLGRPGRARPSLHRRLRRCPGVRRRNGSARRCRSAPGRRTTMRHTGAGNRPVPVPGTVHRSDFRWTIPPYSGGSGAATGAPGQPYPVTLFSGRSPAGRRNRSVRIRLACTLPLYGLGLKDVSPARPGQRVHGR